MSIFAKKPKKVVKKRYKNASNRAYSRYVDENKSEHYDVRLSRNDMKFVYDALKSIENLDIEEYCIALDNNDNKRMRYMDKSIKNNRAIRARMARQLVNKKTYSVKK